MTLVDDAIDKYKAELLGESELARDDLQEIEDHLRSLTAELRSGGMPEAQAVRVACERLGNPRAIAREHARVRSPFGARLSHARSISAAVLLLAVLVQPLRGIAGPHAIAAQTLMTVLETAMVVALLARLTWARAFVLGCSGFWAIFAIHGFVMDGLPLWLAVACVGVPLFVMPWRRAELGRAGLALALQAFAAGVATFATGLIHDRFNGVVVLMAPAAQTSCLALVIAVSGTVLRARWATIAAMAGAGTLLLSAFETAPYFFRYRAYFVLVEWLPTAATMAAGAVAAVVAGVISWRSARSATGTLQYVLR